MKERRGLFEAIFGRKPQTLDGYTEYKLLNSYQSNFVPFSGNAWEVNTVRAAIHSFARRAARVQPRHIRKGDGKLQDVESSSLNYILQYQPNPLTTAYKFYYRAAAQYKLYNNAFIFPVWNEYTGRLEAIDVDNNMVRVTVSALFGKETMVELELDQVEPIAD